MNNIVLCARNSNTFYTKLQDPENMNDVRYFIKDLEKSRMDETDSKVTTITDIRTSLENLKISVFNNITEDEKIGSLKVKMYEIEEKINNVKNEIISELKFLIRSEHNSLKDLLFLEKKIDDWDKSTSIQTIRPVISGSYSTQSSNSHNPSVKFQKFLSIFGGHTGGWPEQDHILFIKERKKCKGNYNFIKTILRLLPNLRYSDVMEHEKWYVKYMEFQGNVREAIKKWKADKIMEQNLQNKTNMEQKNVKSSKKLTYCSNVADKIKEWKQQQMSNRLEEYQKQKKEEQRLKAEEGKLKKIQVAKKLLVNQYKVDKLKKIQINISRLEKTQNFESKKLNSDLIKFFRLQDVKFIQKKKIIQLQLQSKQKVVKKLKVSKPTTDLMLKRDPNRVLQPTLIWDLHCQTNNQKKGLVPCDVNSIPHLAIPEWRKDLKWK